MPICVCVCVCVCARARACVCVCVCVCVMSIIHVVQKNTSFFNLHFLVSLWYSLKNSFAISILQDSIIIALTIYQHFLNITLNASDLSCYVCIALNV